MSADLESYVEATEGTRVAPEDELEKIDEKFGEPGGSVAPPVTGGP